MEWPLGRMESRDTMIMPWPPLANSPGQGSPMKELPRGSPCDSQEIGHQQSDFRRL